MKYCLMCNDPLPRPIDEFGDIGLEVCQVCWLKYGSDGGMPESWYGLGPHEHSYTEDGQIIIGGTKMLPLPEPNQNGEYVINGLIFTPDLKAPGMGMWSKHGRDI